MTPEQRAKAVITAWTRDRCSLRVVRELIAAEIAAAVESERERCAALVKDLWQYATGHAWGELDEEAVAADGDALADLHRRVAALLAGEPS